jgi:HK97 family phage prohead protease
MKPMYTESVSALRVSATDPRLIEGTAVPYGVVATDTDQGREVFAPGAFSANVEYWNGRQDGARMAFRPAHREKPIGTVQALTDTPEGVLFAARVFDTPAGDEYLAQVEAGLNGVSIEAGLDPAPRRMRDGTAVHRTARLHAIAGSISPAYDGARIALRDMETETMDENPTTEAQTPPEPAQAERDRTERNDPIVSEIRSGAILTRAESVYGPRSEHSFLRDVAMSARGDTDAAERRSRHEAMLTDVARMAERAGDVVSAEIPGMYPNDYMPGLLTPRILKGRPMGGFFDRVPISDARPRVFAKVTTSGAVAVQAAEGTNPAATDVATTAVTATPLLYGAYTDVSRQVVDGGDPSAFQMILQDLIEGYAQASETVIKTAVEAGASASGTAITAATPYAGTIGNVITYYGTRFRPAQGVFVPSALYAVLLNQLSAGDGRPLMPFFSPANTDASVEAGATNGNVLGATAYLSYASTANVVVTARKADYVIYESSVAQFTYDQPVGPAAVRFGIWAYLVVAARLGSLKVTAA